MRPSLERSRGEEIEAFDATSIVAEHRAALLRRMTPWILGLTAMAWLGGIPNDIRTGEWFLPTTFGVMFILMCAVLLPRNVPEKIKAYSIVIFAFATGALCTIFQGIGSSGPPVLLFTCVLCGTVVGNVSVVSIANAALLTIAPHLWPVEVPGTVVVAIGGAIVFFGFLAGTISNRLTIQLGEAVYAQRVAELALQQEFDEQNRLRNRLRVAEKREGLGQLAAGIAHDFNNLLVPILANSELLSARTNPDDKNAAVVADIVSAAERSRALLAQIRTYAGETVEASRLLDMSEEVQAIAALTQSSLPPEVDLHVSCGTSLPIEADEAKLHQIVMNCLINAGEAIGNRAGEIHVHTHDASLTTLEASNLIPPEPRSGGGYACCSVRDTGSGISTEIEERIFDPYATTKGNGRGLGLATALAAARGFGGGFMLDTRVGEGTEISLYLPLADGEKSVAADERSRGEARRSTVAVVDDAEDVRRACLRVLQSEGFRVIEYQGGREVVEALSSGQAVDLVVLDMLMPGWSGEKTFRELRAIQSELPILLCSGYAVGETVSRVTKNERVNFLPKPYLPSELVEAVNALLNS